MHQQGHTLLGLMLTLAIASVLMLLAAPSFSGLVDRTRLEVNSERLFSALWLARTEAIARRETVVIEAIDQQWDNGWRIFADHNGDGLWQQSEPVFRQTLALPVGYTLTANSGIGKAVYYQPDGRTQKPGGSLQMGRFELCTEGASQIIVINSVGRPRLEPVSPLDC